MPASKSLGGSEHTSALQTFVFSDVHTDFTAGILVQFAERIAARGHRVIFLHPEPSGSRALIDRFTSFGAEAYVVPTLSGRSPWAVARGMENVLDAIDVANPILIACESVPMRGQAMLGRRRRWRTVFHMLNLRNGIDARTYLRERIDARLVRRSGGIVLGCSRSICEHWTERVELDPNRVAYFPNWIDLARFAPGRPGQAVQPDAFDPACLPTICCVAGFSPVKQHDLLIRAIARLRSEGLDLRVLMVGGADRPATQAYFGRCQALAASLAVADRVRFLGARGDVPELLRQSDMFVLPSRQEGLACALLEAMATALPVIAAGIHASCEVIAHGENGFLFSPRSEQDLAATIRHVVGLPATERRQIGEFARRTVSRRYVWETAFSGIVSFLDRHGIQV